MIGVCPLSKVAQTVARLGARRLLSLLAAGADAPRPPGVAPDDHLVLNFHDIVEPLEGYVHPADSHVAEALAFATQDPGPIVVHCHAGVSRSTAMAYAIACAREPERDEREIAAVLRAASPTATPNRLIVALADAALRRGGRMSAAIAAIGRGAETFEGAPFVIPPATGP